MRKKIIAVCLAVMLACLLWLVKDRWSLPAAQETEHEGLRVGLSQAEPLTPWKTAQIKSFKEAARRRICRYVSAFILHPFEMFYSFEQNLGL